LVQQLAEANATEARRIVPALHKFMSLLHSMLEDGLTLDPGDQFDPQWGRSRNHDMLITLQWLYEKHPEKKSHVLLGTMYHLDDQAYDWAYWFSEGTFPKKDYESYPARWKNQHFPFAHGVNAGQGRFGPILDRDR
jgi:hypothetical protein